MTAGSKTFVLDTNVILHDSSCIEHFDEHDVVIPITVIEELDQFNKDIGFLPGDIQSKLDPYMQPLYDNLAVIQDGVGGQSGMGRRIREMLAEEKIVITALAYIRGRSLVKTYFIVDEAQNLTPHEVKTIITRAWEGTKVVFTGDVFQIDHPYLDSHSNGLSYLIEKMKAQPLAAHVHLEKGERSELSELAARLL